MLKRSSFLVAMSLIQLAFPVVFGQASPDRSTGVQVSTPDMRQPIPEPIRYGDRVLVPLSVIVTRFDGVIVHTHSVKTSPDRPASEVLPSRIPVFFEQRDGSTATDIVDRNVALTPEYAVTALIPDVVVLDKNGKYACKAHRTETLCPDVVQAGSEILLGAADTIPIDYFPPVLPPRILGPSDVASIPDYIEQFPDMSVVVHTRPRPLGDRSGVGDFPKDVRIVTALPTGDRVRGVYYNFKNPGDDVAFARVPARVVLDVDTGEYRAMCFGTSTVYSRSPEKASERKTPYAEVVPVEYPWDSVSHREGFEFSYDTSELPAPIFAKMQPAIARCEQRFRGIFSHETVNMTVRPKLRWLTYTLAPDDFAVTPPFLTADPQGYGMVRQVLEAIPEPL